MFTETDIQFLAQRGSDLQAVQQQLDHFKSGFPFLNIRRAATVGDGIIRMDEEALHASISRYEAALAGLKVIKFVPASGAASRMFKELFAVLESGTIPPEGIAAHWDEITSTEGETQPGGGADQTVKMVGLAMAGQGKA